MIDLDSHVAWIICGLLIAWAVIEVIGEIGVRIIRKRRERKLTDMACQSMHTTKDEDDGWDEGFDDWEFFDDERDYQAPPSRYEIQDSIDKFNGRYFGGSK